MFRRLQGSRVLSAATRRGRIVRPRCRASQTAEGGTDWSQVDWSTYDWRDHLDDEEQRGPAALATLRMLDWATLCTHVATFAATSIAKQRAMQLEIASTSKRAEELQAETKAAEVLETVLSVSLDWGGINSDTVSTALRRAAKGGMLTPEQLQGVSGLLAGTGRLQRLMRTARNAAHNTDNEAAVERLASRLLSQETFPELAKAIDAKIGENGAVLDNASEAVRSTRQRVGTLEGRIKGVLSSQGGEVTLQGGRWCVAVAAGDTPRGGILLANTGRSGMMYVEPAAAVPLNNQLVAAQAEAMAAEETILWELTSSVIDRLDQLRSVLDVVVWLDVICCRYRYSAWIEGTYPTFIPFPSMSVKATKPDARPAEARGALSSGDDASHTVFLKRLRHPLLHATYLEQMHTLRKSQGKGLTRGSSQRFSNRKVSPAEARAAAPDRRGEEPRPVVPVDITIPLKTRSVIITGPNTGGKTASLKALGLAVLMAKAGLAIPAAAPAQLPPFSAVLADIGDEQSLSASLSTFSGHLKRIQASAFQRARRWLQALRAEADGKCLVLLDEVGTGTDPTEGTALGLALLQTLVNGGPGGAALTVCTTHMSALTALKYEDVRFENASAEFDEVELKPTYKLLWGVPGRSNALNICSLLGVPADVIQVARDFIGTSQNRLDELIDQLEDARRATERDEEYVELHRRRLAELQAQLLPLERTCAEQRAKAELVRSNILSAAMSKASASLSRVAQAQKLATCAAEEQQRAVQTRAAEAVQDARAVEAQAELKWIPQVGEVVYVPKLGSDACVSSVSKNKVSVECGALKVTVKMVDIRRK